MKPKSLNETCRQALPLFLLAFGAVQSGAQAQSASVLAEHDNYLPGQLIGVSFAGGPGAKKDWVGVYPEGVVPGSQGSTLWNYVDNTRGGNTGLKEGKVTFPAGLNFAGKWFAYLLENDGYTILAETSFNVIEPTAALVHVNKRVYAPGETIAITFTNGPANTKDWIGVYPVGEVPGSQGSTIWNYVDGTQTGSKPVSAGTISFTTGLSKVGEWTAFLLENDGYTVLASENFKVAVNANDVPRVASIEPAQGATNTPPAASFAATIVNGGVKVTSASVVLNLDNTKVVHQLREEADKLFVTYAGTAALASDSKHTFTLIFADAVGGRYTNSVEFTVGTYTDIKLPAPLYLETFDTVAEGKLPAGWSETSYTEVQNDEVDFKNLDSAAYKTWTTVDVERFRGTFNTYSNPETSAGEANDYQRVLRTDGRSVVNGAVIRDMAKGRMLFGDSGYRRGRSQVMFLTTPSFDFTGKKNIFLSYHSLWEQNQDSIAALEYSADGGQSWLPVAYHLDGRDVKTNDLGQVDIEATFTTEYGDVARYADEQGNELGGTYGAFVGAKLALIQPSHIQPRVDDNPTDGKRVELFRLEGADNQKSVRLRFAHAGTDSWYWGVDEVGFYSIDPAPAVAPSLSVQRANTGLKLSWTGGVGFVLESSDTLGKAAWSAVANLPAGVSELEIPTAQIATGARYYRLRKP